MDNRYISVIIPCFNEEEVVEEAYSRISNVLREKTYTAYELLFVNDGSTDRTGQLLAGLAAKDEHVRVISFSRNFGHQPAVTAGINHCKGNLAIIIDADMQDPPEAIPPMIETYDREQCNAVYGVRKTRKGEGFFKRMTAIMYYRLLNKVSESDFPVDTGDFRLIDRKVIDAFRQLKEKNKYIRGLVSWVGFTQVPYYYDRDKRYAGKTKFPLSKMLRFATTGLLYFTKKPLNLAINLGFLCLLVGMALGAYALVVRLSGQFFYMAGWTSTMIAIIFFGGVQLLTVGIIGKYIGSIFDEVKQRPEYIIDEKINLD